MSDYRLVANGNGFAAAGLTEAELAASFRNIKAMRRDAYVDFGLVLKGHVAVETIREAKLLTGGSFREWVIANFAGGRGPLANLMRGIVQFLNGRIAYAQLSTMISIEENKLESAYRTRGGVYSQTLISGGVDDLLKEKGDTLYDFDLYRLLAGIAPAGVFRILLLLGGETYYG